MSEIRKRQIQVVYLATDHAGFALKEEIKAWLTTENFVVIDGGADSLDAEDDFSDYVTPVAVAVANEQRNEVGAVIFGGSGQGEAMAANRIKGVRAAVYYGGNQTIPTLAREHNNSNVLSLGARFVTADEAKWAIWEWAHTTALEAEKYQRRNQKLDK